MNTTVLLIDRNTIFCNGVTNLLAQHNIDVVATANNGDEGIRLLEQLSPDMILLDTDMPQGNSLNVLEQLRAQQAAKVVLLTSRINNNTLKKMLQAGADGYLSKRIDPEELVAAIQHTLAGQTVVPPELAFVLVRFQKAQAEAHNQQQELSALIATLTPREYETLLLLTKGLNNKMIARQMGLTEGTVKNHVKAILSKLNVKTRINAAVIALQHGIGVDTE